MVESMAKCSVLGGRFALAMQGLLFFITLSVLVFKKYREGPGRTWGEFGLDGSKQFLGAGWIHVANLLCAILFAGKVGGIDGCTWYAANIIVDTTVGLLVEWLLLRGVHKFFEKLQWESAVKTLDTGSYYDEEDDEQRVFRKERYVLQLIVWLMIVTTMKVFMVALMRSCPIVVEGIDMALHSLNDQAQLKLFVVMICIPVTMNTFQFLLTDEFIKKKVKSGDEKVGLMVE